MATSVDTTAATAAASTTTATFVAPSLLDPKYAAVNSFQEYLKEIEKTVVDLQSRTQPLSDATLLSDYTSLQKEIQASLDTYTTTEATALTQKLQEYTSKLGALDTRRDTVIAASAPKKTEPVTATEAVKTLFGMALDRLLHILFWLGAGLGGIVGAHTFIERPLLHRLYYFIYGAAFFPITLLFGVYSPPVWRAVVFPLAPRDEVTSTWSAPVVKYITSLFLFSKPSVHDLEGGYGAITKNMLRLFCLGMLGAIGSVYFMTKGVLPIPGA